MVTLTQSLTLPVNPPSSSPTLSARELFQVLLLKCRRPELFIAPITSSSIISETPTQIIRKCRVTSMLSGSVEQKEEEIVERIELTKPWKADFYNETSGAFVSNLISQSEMGEVGDEGGEARQPEVYLTFFFKWEFPGMEEGEEEVRGKERELWGLARKTVQGTIEHARGMKREGKVTGVGYTE